MMLHQNLKQINMNDFFVAANFPKTPSPKPARIPPQTPPAGGKSAEAGRIQNPRKIVSPCRVRIVSISFFGIFCKMGSDFFKQTPLKVGI